MTFIKQIDNVGTKQAHARTHTQPHTLFHSLIYPVKPQMEMRHKNTAPTMTTGGGGSEGAWGVQVTTTAKFKKIYKPQEKKSSLNFKSGWLQDASTSRKNLIELSFRLFHIPVFVCISVVYFKANSSSIMFRIYEKWIL